MASRLHPRPDGRSLSSEHAASTRSRHQHLVRRRRLVLEWGCFDPAGSQPGQAGGFARVNGRAPGGWAPGIHIAKDVARHCLGCRLFLHRLGVLLELGEAALRIGDKVPLVDREDEPAAFAIFEQRAVLERVAAIDDRQEVTAGRLLDQH